MGSFVEGSSMKRLQTMWWFFWAVLLVVVCVEAGNVGFCYGRFGDNLPTPPQVAQFVAQQSISHIRIFDDDPSVIQAFANTNILLLIGIPNSDLLNFQSEQQAQQWISSSLAPLLPASNISAISVGSEIITNFPSLSPLLLPAMQNLHTALTNANLAHIQVTTANSMAILQNSFPPSGASFNQSYSSSFIEPLLAFLKSVGSFVMINAYPYLAYTDDPVTVPLDYALFEAQTPVVDPTTNLHYTSLLDAQLDALYFALEGAGQQELSVVVSETGWPTKGDANEPGATAQNAATYNNNLVSQVVKNVGTPHRPNQAMDVYIFSLFNEDRKAGPESERNWGVFNANETKVYSLDLTGTQTSSSPTSSPATTNVSGTGGTWCIASPSASNVSLKAGLDWACGQGSADCRPIQSGQPCYQPNTLQNHASYAYNSYYQKNGDNPVACNFNGSAMTTTSNPSYGSCTFPSDGSSAPSPSSSINGNSSSVAASNLVPHWELGILPMAFLFTLV